MKGELKVKLEMEIVRKQLDFVVLFNGFVMNMMEEKDTGVK